MWRVGVILSGYLRPGDLHAFRTHAAPDPHAQAPKDPAEAIGAGINTWRAFTLGLPLRLAAETIRFTSRRLQAQADHLAALAGCSSLNDALNVQTAFVTKGMADCRKEATTLSHDVTETAFAKAA